MKNNKLFEEPFLNSQKVDDTFAEIYNNDGFEKAISYLKEIGATWLDMENFAIKYCISEFTKSKNSDSKKEELITSLENINYIKKARITYNSKLNLHEVIIDTLDKPVRAIQFSSLAKRELMPNVEDVLPNLENDERLRQCFNMALNICRYLGIESTIVTGYTYGNTDKSKYLHSWIEVKYKGQEFVIDATLNAVINKEGYYQIQHAQPLTRISKKTLLEDIDKYFVKIGSVPVPQYYLCRDEIINDFRKNEEIFKDR